MFPCRRPFLAAFVSLAIAGCATGVESTTDPLPPEVDADTSDSSQGPDGVAQPDAGPDSQVQDAAEEASDAPDGAVAEAATDASCPDGTSGPGCSQCAAGYHDCGSDCVPDGPNDPATGCSKGCGTACDATLHQIASCSTEGACETTCEAGYEGTTCSECEDGFALCGDSCVESCSTCTDNPVECSGTCVASCDADCNGAIACDDTCMSSCGPCTGKLANCVPTNSCVAQCSACQGQCVECPPGQHACASDCHADAVDDVAHGCKNTCDDQPCHQPNNGQAVCVSGLCDITCNTASGFQKSQSGTECVCNTASGFVEDPVLHACVCPQATKLCNQACVDASDPMLGCSGTACQACTLPPHATVRTCTGAGGTCDFICDAAMGYVKNAQGTACACPPGTVDTGSQCVCATGTKPCNGACVSSSAPANGCSAISCTACTQPLHALSTNCAGTGGTCDFLCDTANGFLKSGSGCVCPAHMVDDGVKCVCDVGYKLCSGTCSSVSEPQTGCSSASCLACPVPAHATSNCAGAGTSCDFTCDAASHWLKSGSGCACDAAGYWVESGGQCVCDPATYRVDMGGQCVCDTAGHWVESGGACACAPGYALSGGTCVSTCPGTAHGNSCYWYVGTGAAFSAAEAACAAQSGHLASVADAAENTFVNSLAPGDFWFGLWDTSTASTTISSADDCNDAIWLNDAGGAWTGTNNEYDDVAPTCTTWDSYDDIVGLTVGTGSMYVFNTVRSNFDTVLGLYNRGTGSGYLGCVGSSIECDDDDAGSSRSLIIRYLAPASYTLVIDGYDGDYGTYVLDVRRFRFTDGSAHAWASWNTREPNNSGGSERCAQMIHASGLWNDLSCTSVLPYVCERPL